ncbi:DUF4230 domain-containing protein [Umezawaea endophytica]|uniref:DUF4230 domain-containing protein n=1 Tax=Umezawaea endophytica TaxID=1654476 RepID=A0A9X2VSJ0_9PSEU|nr:DUF4230 domain-containing protein [Umezawaea endophytica]MCS7481389.1 DUF4230 domain-containing protein [Umezawaea endophytica]
MRLPWRSGSRWVFRGVVAVSLVVVAAAALQLVGVLPKLNPFGTDTIDRSQPALLRSIKDLSQYHAASGDYQVVIDLEKDVRFVPDVLAGQRTLFVSAGTVNAFVDFGGLAENSMTVSQERKTVDIALPKPQLDKPNINHERSYVFAQERGLFDRLTSVVQASDQQPFYVAAEQKISDAAKESGLQAKAEENTRKMLDGMFRALGYEVHFVDVPAP